MAIYHLSVKTISRAAGRSVTGAAAYRAAERIVDQRSGEIHDYTHKQGVLTTDIVLPPGAPDWATERAALWNAAEQSETRCNSTVGREFEIALPDELDEAQRRRLALAFAREIVTRHDCAADIAIHQPGKGGDNRNHHAHILCSTRRLNGAGFHDKTRELDEVKQGEVTRWRERYAQLQNQHLRDAGHPERVDHRSLEDQGIDRTPGVHLGPAATGYERRTGQPSHRRQELQQEIGERLQRARLQGQLERQSAQLQRGIVDTSLDLGAAQQARAGLQQKIAAGRAEARAKFTQHQQEKGQQTRQAEQTLQPHKGAREVQLDPQTDARAEAELERQDRERQASEPTHPRRNKDLDGPDL